MILNTRKRNTTAFTFMAWASFIGAFLAMFIGIYTLEESLSVKGYFAVCALFLTMSAFVLQKVIRDNLEDSYDSRKRNTSAFTFLAWSYDDAPLQAVEKVTEEL
ncbi:hypothetical protein HZF08_31655 [Paenibacillus sp. CGMCC 1.16610]|uniref:YiaAB two helix domain-containing protein n=1 Tax=Paenibacillus anseongense TaxID=2682845 RepID=A0ABW9UH35_9BACL|nr:MULTISPECIES: YiaA/YiaB family inner membrane protein [Paenibacillus]MBA2942831.1 hypothetical protein [Paenibacillus sp. CGMCC 1.16610]MVQ38316.1 hypothetical protein [Paenibacillus anseongense]